MTKIKNISLLKKCYVQDRMSTNDIAKNSLKLFGFSATQGTIYNTLIHYGISLRNKSESTTIGIKTSELKKEVISKQILLNDIVKTKQERWNARWFIASKQIKIQNNVLSPENANKLRTLLIQYGDKWAIPEELIEKEFILARQKGFPIDKLSDEEKIKDWNRLKMVNMTKDHELNAYQWSGIESRLATSFHPHFYEGRCKGRMSPIEFFKSDSDLKRGIAKSLALNGKITDSNLRTICRDEDASSMITNFPPRVAIGIIKEMTSDMKPQVGINGFSLLDPCSGFSGRLIGSCASGKIRRYVGIDLSPHTYAGLIKTEEFMRRQGCDVEIELHQADCIKKMAEMDEKFDLIMTSPPFLDVEEYKDVPFESDYSKWRVEFIKPFVELCFSRLKNEGKLAVYSENITKNKALSNDLSLFAKEAGFIEQKSINFKKTPGAYNLAKRNFRITSIKVWKRP